MVFPRREWSCNVWCAAPCFSEAVRRSDRPDFELGRHGRAVAISSPNETSALMKPENIMNQDIVLRDFMRTRDRAVENCAFVLACDSNSSAAPFPSPAGSEIPRLLVRLPIGNRPRSDSSRNNPDDNLRLDRNFSAEQFP